MPSPGSGYSWDPHYHFGTVPPAAASNCLWPTAPTRNARRPIVRIKVVDLSEVVDQAEAHLIAAEPNIFHKDQQLVYVAAGEFEVAGGLKAVGLRASPFGLHSLMEAMGRASDFRKFVKRSDDWKSVDCPEKVAQAYLSRIQRWRVPLLVGISTTPVHRRGRIRNTKIWRAQSV